jgi:hypothetical protein
VHLETTYGQCCRSETLDAPLEEGEIVNTDTVVWWVGSTVLQETASSIVTEGHSVCVVCIVKVISVMLPTYAALHPQNTL